jgi:hypothetical protein
LLSDAIISYAARIDCNVAIPGTAGVLGVFCTIFNDQLRVTRRMRALT